MGNQGALLRDGNQAGLFPQPMGRRRKRVLIIKGLGVEIGGNSFLGVSSLKCVGMKKRFQLTAAPFAGEMGWFAVLIAKFRGKGLGGFEIFGPDHQIQINKGADLSRMTSKHRLAAH